MKKILFAASEGVPFIKTGGLADVVGSLPKYIDKEYFDVRVFIPKYTCMKQEMKDKLRYVTHFYMDFNWQNVYVGVLEAEEAGVHYYFIDNESYFGGFKPYGDDPRYEIEKYAYFCKAVLSALPLLNFQPDLIHCHDWQTGLIPILLRTQYGHWDIGHAKTIFTIHNMMYQGEFGFDQFEHWLGIDPKYDTPEFMHNYECASFMKAALVFADRLSTVSPTYAQEIRDPAFAYRQEGILNARAGDTWGILNGMNQEEFNPETDPLIPYHFNKDDLSGKKKDKQELIKALGLSITPGVPIIGMVTRLTEQKGLDLVKYMLDEIMCTENVAFVILGTGDYEYEEFFRYMEEKYKGRVCSYIAYDNAVAHQIYAGSDLFLMPSKFEPCGISQMIALRYGTLPIVRETGGLRDTVQSYNEYEDTGNGFSFANYNAHEMLGAIRYALQTLQSPKRKHGLIQRAMESDNSFAKSAKIYLDMYNSVL